MSCSGLNSVEMAPSSGENTTLQCEGTERCTLLIPDHKLRYSCSDLQDIIHSKLYAITMAKL